MTIKLKWFLIEVVGAAVIALIFYHFGLAWKGFLIGVVAGEISIRLWYRYKKWRL